MKENKYLSDTVILIDVPFLNLVISKLKEYFEQTLGRPLKEIDFSDLLVFLTLDAKISSLTNSIQVILVYDDKDTTLYHCFPCNLRTELNEVAFKDDLGEFILNSYQPESMVKLKDLYLEFFKVLLEVKEIKNYILICDDEDYESQFIDIIENSTPKSIVQFKLNKPKESDYIREELFAYPVMQALGVKGNELN